MLFDSVNELALANRLGQVSVTAVLDAPFNGRQTGFAGQGKIGINAAPRSPSSLRMAREAAKP